MRAAVVAESLFSSFEVYPRQPHHFSIADDSLRTARKRIPTTARRGLKEFESMDYVYNPIT